MVGGRGYRQRLRKKRKERNQLWLHNLKVLLTSSG